jgi:CubicO group peptidase (beta-lactamase class C family)
MDIKIQAKTIDIIYKIISKKQFEPAVKFCPTKEDYFENCKVRKSTHLPVDKPMENGISRSYIEAFLNELYKEPSLNIHQCLIVKNGKVIFSKAFSPYRMDIWHVTHSMCKTVTALAIGILVSEGKLTVKDKLTDIFDKELLPLQKIKLGKLTVENLLTMSSGIALNEEVICAESDWLHAYFDSQIKFEPGSKFEYNSMNSYVLSCIVKKLTGISMFDYLKEKLFDKLGIYNVCWESSPQGETKGGWGMYILPEDIAKIGLLLENMGMWNNEQLISPEYIKAMTSKQIEIPDSTAGYGYQLWMGEKSRTYIMNGMLGQYVYCNEPENLVVVITGGNNKLFVSSKTDEIVNRYFIKNDSFCLIDTKPEKNMRNLFNSNAMFQDEKINRSILFPFLTVRRDELTKKMMNKLDGHSYNLEQKYVHILPLFTSLLNNCYTQGISKISFSRVKDDYYMSLIDGEEINKIKIGIKEPEISTITALNEPYIVAAQAKAAANEDGTPVLIVKLPFLEHSDGRIIKIFFYGGNKIKAEFLEVPGKEIIEDGTKSLIGNISNMAPQPIKSFLDTDIILDLCCNMTKPEIYGNLDKNDNQ